MFLPRHSEGLGRVSSKAWNGTKFCKNIVLQNSQNNLSVPKKSSFLTISLGKSPVGHLSHKSTFCSIQDDSLFCGFEHRFTGTGKQALLCTLTGTVLLPVRVDIVFAGATILAGEGGALVNVETAVFTSEARLKSSGASCSLYCYHCYDSRIAIIYINVFISFYSLSFIALIYINYCTSSPFISFSKNVKSKKLRKKIILLPS